MNKGEGLPKPSVCEIMKLSFLSIIISLAAPVFAVSKMPMIEAVDDDLIYLSNGQVIFKDQVKSKAGRKNVAVPSVTPELNYTPTILPDQVTAYKVYNQMRSDYRDEAECTNMAHVWTYEEYKRSGLKSQKIFLFFTRKYIMRYRYGWWFHVSPLVQAKQDKETLEIVLDRRYTTSPLDTKNWTDQFIENKSVCKEIDKISTFWNNQRSEDCYLMKVPMYYWQPRDIRLNEQNGKDKLRFVPGEVSQAYEQAFNQR
jgi:hypothetical protein